MKSKLAILTTNVEYKISLMESSSSISSSSNHAGKTLKILAREAKDRFILIETYLILIVRTQIMGKYTARITRQIISAILTTPHLIKVALPLKIWID